MQTQPNSTVAVSDDGPIRGAVPSGILLQCDDLRKVFRSGAQEIVPIDGLNFSIGRGEMISIVGPSGTGKSTLLHVLAALDTPTSGTVYFGGNSLRSFSEAELAEYRNRAVGLVWQRHHLLPDFTAAENVAMPLLVRRWGKRSKRPANGSQRWGWPVEPNSVPVSFPEANSSAWPLRARW
jgi:ABC-type lipoprotein export system ATPase subunit